MSQTRWEAHLLKENQRLRERAEKLRNALHYQRKRAELWRHRALRKAKKEKT